MRINVSLPIMINGSYPPGGLIIIHTPLRDIPAPPDKDNPALIVLIPFKSSGQTSTASQIITDIINNSVAKKYDATYNIQDIIPRGSFFNFKIQETQSVIVFGDSLAIPLSSATIQTLQKIISPLDQKFPPIKELFYNQKGTGSGLLSGLSSGFTSFTGPSSIPGFSSSPQLITQSPTQPLANPQSAPSNITDISMKNVTGNCDTNCS